VASRVPDHLRGPVRVDSVRTARVEVESPGPYGGYGPVQPLVIEGEIVRGPDGRPAT
jgi:UPF0716 protein FxsA